MYRISRELSGLLRTWRHGQGFWNPSEVRKLDKTEHCEYLGLIRVVALDSRLVSSLIYHTSSFIRAEGVVIDEQTTGNGAQKAEVHKFNS